MRDATRTVVERLPGPVAPLVDAVTRSHTLTLAAGLAFFGLISLAPAIGFALGLLRLVTGDATAEALTSALEDTFPHTLGLADLIDQMQDRAGRYAGLAFLVLLWPATTLASGWTRALDAVNEEDSTGGLRGLRGRAKGLLVGGGLLGGLLVILGLAATATTLAGGERPVLLVAAFGGGLGVIFAFCLAAYRWLPSESHDVATLWRGALIATAGVVATTVGFAVALGYADQLAEQYPPALSTAVVLGLWLYFANTALLFGEQYNAIRRRRERPEEERGHRERAAGEV